MCIGNAVQETIQTNKNGEFAGDVQLKLPWIPEAPGLVVERITVGHSFSQLSEVEPEHCKNGNQLSRFDQSQSIPESRYGLLIGCVKQLDASRNHRSRFPVFLGASGIQGSCDAGLLTFGDKF